MWLKTVELDIRSKITSAETVVGSSPLDPQWRMISQETKGIIDRLLLEKLALAGIARALQISELWLQQYVNQKYKQVHS